ncbi:hypothetical protein VCHC48B2_3305, partial [Vibrio cholerae HC-48B2]
KPPLSAAESKQWRPFYSGSEKCCREINKLVNEQFFLTGE